MKKIKSKVIIIFLGIIIILTSIYPIYNHLTLTNKYDGMYLIKSSKNFNIYCYTKDNDKYLSKEFLEQITSSTEDTYSEFTKLFNSNFNEKIDIKIYETSIDLGKSIGMGNCTNLGYGGLGDVLVVLDIKSIVNKQFISTINHELIHVITLNENKKLSNNIALLEGISTFYANGITPEQKKFIKKFSGDTDVISINSILSNNTNKTFDKFGYSLYAALIDYIDKTFGREMIATINKEIGTKSLFEILDCSSEELEKDFIEYINLKY